MFKILVLDAAQRSALAVTRSLGALPNFEVITAEDSPATLASTSKYCTRHIQSPSSKQQPIEYIDWINELTQNCHFDLVIPITEITSQLLLQNLHSLPKIKLPFTTYASVMSLANKYNLVVQAQAAGVPIPKFDYYENAAKLVPDKLHYPCVLKPCLSHLYKDGKWTSTSVKILNSSADLNLALASCSYLKTSSFMIQEYVPGKGAGIFCLYNKGQPSCFFAHKRVREKPPQGGVSVLSESIAVDPQLEKYARQLLGQVNWEGVAMVEFRITPEGQPYLMEVNTRFWGSLQLAIDAGVNFPKLLSFQFLGLDSSPSKDYILHKKLRWLLGDLDSLYLTLRGQGGMLHKLKAVGSFFTPTSSCKHEINRLDDLGPAWYELKQYIKQLLSS